MVMGYQFLDCRLWQCSSSVSSIFESLALSRFLLRHSSRLFRSYSQHTIVLSLFAVVSLPLSLHVFKLLAYLKSVYKDFSFVKLQHIQGIIYPHSAVFLTISKIQVNMLLRLVATSSLVLRHGYAISPSAVAPNTPAASVQAASTDNGGLVTEGVATLDGLKLDAIAEGRSAEALLSTSIPRTNWSATADSAQPGFPPPNVLDGDLNTFWHTTYTVGLPPSAMSGVSSL